MQTTNLQPSSHTQASGRISWKIPEGMSVERENGVVLDEYLRLKSEKLYGLMVQLVKSQWDLKRVLDPRCVLESVTMSDIPGPGSKPIVDQKYTSKTQVLAYHAICQQYADIMGNDPVFQETYIQLCYHVGDFETLRNVGEIYLKNEELHDSTVGYILTGLVHNYEPVLARDVLEVVTQDRKDLDMVVLEDLLFAMAQNDSLYQTISHALQTWILSRNAIPSAKAMATVLSQAYKNGTVAEVREVEHLVYRYGLNEDYLIQMVKLKHRIKSRNKTAFKKTVLPEDWVIVDTLATELKQNEQFDSLKHLYYIVMDFMVRYASMSEVEEALQRMRQQDVFPTSEIYELLMKYYLIHEKFMDLCNFLVISNIHRVIPIKLEYIETVFEAFVRSYPHYAKSFMYKYVRFIGLSIIDKQKKQELIDNSKLQKLESQIRPFVVGQKSLNPRKYKSETWEPIIYSHKGRKPTKQVKFRIEVGFVDLLKQGVKPDFHVIEETFRRSSLFYKTRILELAQDIRMLLKNQNRLSIINLQFATKDELSMFFKYNLDNLNSNNLVAFSRILFNRNLYQESLQVLESINVNELTNSSMMVVLSYKLRALFHSEDYTGFIKALDSFPLDTIYLSPYLLERCIRMEKKLLNRREKLQEQLDTEVQGEVPEELQIQRHKQEIEDCISRLRSFIGDCRMIIDQDKKNIDRRTDEVFEILSTWISKLHNN